MDFVFLCVSEVGDFIIHKTCLFYSLYWYSWLFDKLSNLLHSDLLFMVRAVFVVRSSAVFALCIVAWCCCWAVLTSFCALLCGVHVVRCCVVFFSVCAIFLCVNVGGLCFLSFVDVWHSCCVLFLLCVLCSCCSLLIMLCMRCSSCCVLLFVLSVCVLFLLVVVLDVHVMFLCVVVWWSCWMVFLLCSLVTLASF